MSTTKPRQPRRWTTDAQRKAARRNGAKTKGPVTPAGIAASSANSSSHGAFATSLDLSDIPGYYDRFRDLLIEFDVTHHSQLAPVEALLEDMLRSDLYFDITEFLDKSSHANDTHIATGHTLEAYLRANSRATRRYERLLEKQRNEPGKPPKHFPSITSNQKINPPARSYAQFRLNHQIL